MGRGARGAAFFICWDRATPVAHICGSHSARAPLEWRAPSHDASRRLAVQKSMSMNAVIAKGVSKRYGPTLALDSLDLEIERGEVFGLLGPNGSGKTTFIRLLAGYLLPTAGHLEIDGCDSVRDSLRARARIGYVPDAAPGYGNMRVREFLTFMARLRGLPARQVGGAVDRVIDMLALGPVAHPPARALR